MNSFPQSFAFPSTITVRSFSIFAWLKWKSIASTNATKPIITLFNPRAKNYVSLYFGENISSRSHALREEADQGERDRESET